MLKINKNRIMIERNPKILGGALVIKGTRVPVSKILFILSNERTINDIVEIDYPHLSRYAITKALGELAEEIERDNNLPIY